MDLSDRSSDTSIWESIKELSNSDQTTVNLEIRESSVGDIRIIQLDIDLFSKIKEIQELPDWVIIKLILVRGKLKNSNFEQQMLHG